MSSTLEAEDPLEGLCPESPIPLNEGILGVPLRDPLRDL